MFATDQEPYNPEPRIRRVYVYRLKIEYPEGSFKPGWRPANWLDPVILSQMSSLQRWRHRRSEFRWPRERMFLSASSANDRAWILRACGAKVEIQRSQQVEWEADVATEAPLGPVDNPELDMVCVVLTTVNVARELWGTPTTHREPLTEYM